MKRVLFTFGLLGCFFLLKAQHENNGFLLSGEVVYQETVKMDIKLEGSLKLGELGDGFWH